MCSVSACGSRAFCRGWCVKHYTRWQRHGDPLFVTRQPPIAEAAAEKFCPRCTRTRALSYFAYRTAQQGGRKGYCRECEAGYARERLSGSLSARQAKRRVSRDYNRRTAGQRMQKMYGITLTDYDVMVSSQGGRCAVCRASQPGGTGKRWHIDHDHATGRVRGLLCTRCNVGLGCFADDIDRLLAAAAYIEASQLPAEDAA